MEISNPILVGSGLLTDNEKKIKKLFENGAGAVVTKTIHPRHSPSTNEGVFHLPTGMLNNTTYSKKSISTWCEILKNLRNMNLPIIASIYADSPEELGSLASTIESTGCQALELGLSCINDHKNSQMSTNLIAEYTKSVFNSVKIPFSVKLSVSSDTDKHVEAAINAGASAITLSDTLEGISIDIDSGSTRLGGICGYSGSGIKPLVLAKIYQLKNTNCNVPILGVGGINNVDDIIEYLSVGASVVQIYTALHSGGINKMTLLSDGLKQWFSKRNKTYDNIFCQALK